MRRVRYVRFVVAEIDSSSEHRQGLIHALERIEAMGLLGDKDAARAKAAFAWFNKHLPVPGRLSRSAKAHPQKVALSWFKDSASEPIAQIREIASILEAHSIRTEMICTDRPGYVVYEDEWQIAAEPFADTPT